MAGNQVQKSNDVLATEPTFAEWLKGGQQPDNLTEAFAAASDEDKATAFALVLGYRDNLSAQIGKLAGTILQLNLRGDEDGGACEIAEIRLRELTDELAAVKRSLSAQKGSATKARATVAAMVAAGKPRKIGAMDNTLSPRELLELIEDAETVEIVCSDGRHEIKGLAPIAIEGEAWREITAGLKLQVPELTLHGPAPGSPSHSLAGYGLLLDGQQVAWGARADKRAIGAGMSLNIKDDVVFQKPVPKAAADA